MEKIYQHWLEITEPYPDLHQELLDISGDKAQIEDRFYRELAFGTAGMRGILGAGTNRMNEITLARAAAAVSKYLLTQSDLPSIAISYDTRHKSREFARISASVYASYGIRVHLFENIMPTPILSYAVRRLKCTGGAMVTASHNPKQYNGYKIYGDDGCQIGAEVAEEIENNMRSHSVDGAVTQQDFDRAVRQGMISFVPDTLYEDYMAEILKYSLSDGQIDFKIVFTPLNGTGNLPVRDILNRIGAKNIMVVPEQERPDPDFTTCPYPNPESADALDLAIALANKENADLVIATDPDADRVGIAVRHGGSMRLISGNELGVLLCSYILSRKKTLGTLPKTPVIIKTVVTTTMPEVIIKDYGGYCIDTFTGFKHIGEKVGQLESQGKLSDLILAFEESYGYLPGGYIRDKDAVATSMLIAEMADYYAEKGQNLVEVLKQLYRRYGHYVSITRAYDFNGKQGAAKMKSIVADFRKNPPAEICGQKVIEVKDYLQGIEGMESADVLSYKTEELKAILRPSGTEPKLKIYVHIHGPDEDDCSRQAEAAFECMESRME